MDTKKYSWRMVLEYVGVTATLVMWMGGHLFLALWMLVGVGVMYGALGRPRRTVASWG